MPNFRFLLHDNIYYEMSGVVIEDQPSGSIRIILLNGKVIYFHSDAAKSLRDFLSLPFWPHLPVIDTGYIHKYIAEAQDSASEYEDPASGPYADYRPPSPVAPNGPKLPLTLPPVSHPGFPLGYGDTSGNFNAGPINTDKSRAGVNAINAVPGSPKLNIVAIRKAAGIHEEK